jgi:hypothetical protein
MWKFELEREVVSGGTRAGYTKGAEGVTQREQDGHKGKEVTI